MYTITEQEYNAKHKDYKGVWSSDNIHGTNHDGKRTMLHYGEGGTCLIIESVHFTIVKSETENINPLPRR
jgi:hypothetical protein